MKKGLYIIHRLPGRIRFYMPELHRCKETAEIINRALLQAEGVYCVRANPLTGRVLISFDEKKLSIYKIIYLLDRCRQGEHGRIEAACTGKKAVVKTKEGKTLPSGKVIEPEDLSIGRQLFNVALGGCVLALLTLKHLTVGKSRLAGSKHLFNLAAATTLVSGYPVLRSGIQQLARGRVNHDLIMGALSLITVLLRESIPGLTVILLVNLTALLQSLVRAAARQAMEKAGENFHESVLQEVEPIAAQDDHISWREQAGHYGERVVPLSAGLAGLTGLITRDFNCSLAMLLAASPTPAGLGASTAQTAALTGAVKRGIMIKEPAALERMARVNCLLLPGSVLKPTVQVGHVYPLAELSVSDIMGLAACLTGGNHSLSWSGALGAEARARGIKAGRAQDISAGSEGVTGYIGDGTAVVGTGRFLQECGIKPHSAVWKVRRLEHYGEEPLYVVQNQKVVGLIGIKKKLSPENFSWLGKLKSLGISQIIAVDKYFSEDERLNLVRQLRSEGNVVAYAGWNKPDLPALSAADLSLAYVGSEPGVIHRAGVLLTLESLAQILEFRRLVFQAEEKFHRNLSLVRGLNLLGLGLGAAGRLSPVGASLFNNLSSIITAVNSLHLGVSLRKKRS